MLTSQLNPGTAPVDRDNRGELQRVLSVDFLKKLKENNAD
jgi:hypothetical protein